MGVTCPACGTENRSVAKFCIECIGSLPTIFAATEILPHMPSLSQAAQRSTFVREPGIRDESALPRNSGFVAAIDVASVAPAASATASASQTPRISKGPRRTVEARKGLWVSVAAFAIALVIGAAGWLVAGAGGLYIYAFGHSGASAEPGVVMVTAPAAVSMTVASPSAQSAPPVPAAAVAATAIAAPQSTLTSTPPATATTPASGRTTAKLAGPVPASTGRAPTATAATDPGAQCTGLGFFAASRCMASQCAKAEHSAHTACAAVRQQQRLMEEKRNPTMAN